MGAGRTELAMSVFGRAYGRNITRQGADGRQRRSTSRPIQKAVAAGLAYVTEDRKTLGLVLNEDIKNNITLANLPGVAWRGVIDDAREAAVANRYRADAAASARPASSSGRSIFPAAISRRSCSANGCSPSRKVLILDEPTRGIDVGAKYEIYTHHQRARRAGQRRDRHLLGNAGAARHLRPHLCDERRPVRRRNAGQGSQQEKIMASIMRQYGTVQ